MRPLSFFLPLTLVLLLVPPVSAQVNDSGIYIDQTPGVETARADLNVNGNQVESIITNYGLIGKGNGSINQAGVWPKGTGHGHLHMMTGWVGAQVTLANGRDTTIVSDGYLEGGTGPLAENDGTVKWKFHPKPGYLNTTLAVQEIANALNPDSWPPSWPGKPAEWSGLWNGFFGLNQFNADQEVYYVMDDWTNREFSFFPFGQANPDKRGLGMQVDVRLFQWSQALAKDILFMQYQVSNVGTVTYTDNLAENPLFFGGYTDTNPGGSGASNDAAAFDIQRDLVYGWAADGIGTWTQFREIPPGYVGWKYLESPSIDDDGIDNDSDGLTDESRDNDAGTLIFGPCGIYGEPTEHWSGDEDCDWNPKIDDKGSDGIGPEEEGYPGPDADGTEGNGRPDQGEPNFGKLDKDESDQVGLTSFNAPPFGIIDIRDEAAMREPMQPGFFDVPLQNANQIWIFASGPFALEPNRTERFSTAFLWGVNEDALFRTSQVAQRIFDADYRFARPPRQPEVRAVAGDGQVTLIWDDLAELSRDPIYGRDFEGYRVIKSTDPQFRDAQDITDAFGNAVYKRSVAQFDKINGLTGPHPLQFGEEIDLPNGVHFYMGDDTGLQHSYVDTDVVNGRTYYYAVLSYDAGYDLNFFEDGIADIDDLFPISPSESPGSITVTNGVVTNFDKNTVAATPNPPASDLEPGQLLTDDGNQVPQVAGPATGTVSAFALSSGILPDDTFTITFSEDTLDASVEYRTQTFTVTDNSGAVVTNRVPVPTNADGSQRQVWTHELLDAGILLQFANDTTSEATTQQLSRWDEARQNTVNATVTSATSFAFPGGVRWPINAVVEIGEPGVVIDTAFFSTTGNRLTPVSFKVYEEGTGRPLDFLFDEPRDTRNGDLDPGEFIQLVFKDEPTDSRFTPAWTIAFDTTGLDPADYVAFQPGDQYYLRSLIPFGSSDAYAVASVAEQRVQNPQERLLDEVYVVPNPYVAAHAAERRAFLSGRGERRIFFRRLPQNSRIRIYTASGVFVREIEGVNGVAEWDLQTKDGLEAAFGLYFYHLKAEGIGEKVGKFAIIN